MGLINFGERVVSAFLHKFFISISLLNKKRGHVLMIHSVGANNDSEFNLSADHFEKLLQYLSSKNVIRLDNCLSEDNYYALTIDDVPYSFYKNAFPLLKQYEIPFTIFVSTSLLDTKGYINSEQLQEVANCPLCSVGSHGHSHTMFKQFTKEEANADLLYSKNKLSQIVNKEIHLYAFPYGSYYACGYKNKNIVCKLYKYGFGTVSCAISKHNLLPKYFLPRINVDTVFINKLSCYDSTES